MFSVIFTLWYLSVVSLILIILSTTPVHSVLFGICFYIFFGSMLIYSGYDFIGIILILVYAGSLTVMFLFVVMAFDLTRCSSVSNVSSSYSGSKSWGRSVVVLTVFILISNMYRYIWCTYLDINCYCTVLPFDSSANFYNVIVPNCNSVSSLINELGVSFYQCFSVPLVLCGFMIIVGLVGSISLAGIFRVLPVKRRGVSIPVQSSRFEYRVVVLRK